MERDGFSRPFCDIVREDDLRGNATHETESFDRAAARGESRTAVRGQRNPRAVFPLPAAPWRW